MKISVITVSYNSAATIAAALTSVAEQTWPSVEHILVDGASTDGTLGIAQLYGGHLARIVSERDLGIYDAMNKGLRLATGDVIGFLNSDDVYANQNVLREYGEAFRNPAVDVCYGDLVYVLKDDLAKIVRHWRSRPYVDGAFASGWVPPHPTFYARSSVYQEHGAFDLSMPLAADFELMCRLVHSGVRTQYLPGVKVRMRLGGATNASLINIMRQNSEILRAMRLHGVPVGLRYVLGKVSDRVSQFLDKSSTWTG